MRYNIPRYIGKLLGTFVRRRVEHSAVCVSEVAVGGISHGRVLNFRSFSIISTLSEELLILHFVDDIQGMSF